MTRFLVSAILILVALPAAARAEEPAGEDSTAAFGRPDSVLIGEAPPESTTAGTSRPAQQPGYSSSYSVNRTQASWEQKFQVGRSWEKAEVNYSISLTLGEDTRLRGRRTKNGSTKAMAKLRLRPDVSLDLSATQSKNNLLYTTTETRIGRDALELGLEYSPKLIEKLTGNVTAKMSFRRSRELFLQPDRDTLFSGGTPIPISVDREDLTISRGTGFNVGGRLQFSLLDALKWDVNGSEDYARLAAATDITKREKGDVYGYVGRESISHENENITRNLSSALTFSRGKSLGVKLTGKLQDARSEYFEPRAGVESKLGGRKELDFNLNYNLGTLLKLSTISNVSKGSVEYALQPDRNQDVAKRSLKSTVELSPRPGTKLTNVFTWGLQRTEYSTLLPPEDLETRSLESKFTQKFGRKASLALANRIDLSSWMYEDPSRDRDTYFQRMDFNLTYRLFNQIATSLFFGRTTRKTVNIDQTRSSNNTTENVWTLRPTFSWPLSRWSKLTQQYSFTADYTFYDFDEMRNDLVRVREIVTSFTTNLLDELKLTMDHRFQYRDTGSYSREPGASRRTYSKSTERETQGLRLTVAYAPRAWLTFRVAERLYAIDEYRYDSEGRRKLNSEGRQLELVAGIDFSYKFSDGSKAVATIERFQNRFPQESSLLGSRVQDPRYSQMRVMVNKRF